MKIYIAHSKDFDFQNELYEPIQQSEMGRTHAFFLPHDGTAEIKTKDIIKNSQLLVAEISYPSIGVGIELGWADAFGVPVVAFYKEGVKPSYSVQFVAHKCMSYKDASELVALIQEELKNYGA
jgi:hypothetical protein